MVTPAGATHYCEPFYYRIKGRKVEVYGENGWGPSLHSVSSLRSEPDFKPVKSGKASIHCTGADGYLERPTWRKGYDDAD